jgi:hypothetical protein
LVAPSIARFEQLVSKPRLDKYRPANRDDLEMLVNYLWNVALSEAFLQGLAALEVGLRNAVHNTLSNHVGTEHWLHAVLKPDEMRIVTDAWTRLSKRHGRPPMPGQIIAELTFGFWPPLFDTGYQDLWWVNRTARFRATFPNIPAGLLPHQAIVPKMIHERIDLCYKLRNRVMHHEPIYAGLILLNKPTVPLVDIHGHVTETLGWIDPHLATAPGFVDRFPDVHQHEAARIRVRFKTHCGIP